MGQKEEDQRKISLLQSKMKDYQLQICSLENDLRDLKKGERNVKEERVLRKELVPLSPLSSSSPRFVSFFFLSL